MAAGARRPVVPEDLLRLVLVADPQISPDGSSILFTRKHVGEKNEYVANLWLVPAAGGEARPLTQGGRDGRGRWSPDGRRVAFIGARDKSRPQVFVLRADGGEAVALSRFPEGKIAELRWSPDGRRIAVAFREAEPDFTEEARKQREEKGLSRPPRVIDGLPYRLDGDGYFGDRRFALHVIDAATGEQRPVFERVRSFGFAFDWSPDSRELVVAANVEARAVVEPWRDRLFRVGAATGKAKELGRAPEGLKVAVLWSPDGERIAWVGRDDRQGLWLERNYHLFVADAASGASRNLTGKSDYCLLAETTGDTREIEFQAKVRWAPDGSRLVAGIAWKGETQVAAIDARKGGIRFLTRGRRELGLGNLSADGTRAALLEGAALAPAEVAVGRFQGARLATKVLTAFNAKLLSELDLAAPEARWVRSTGGARVHLWLMRPRGLKPGRKAPAVLQVHGGPHVQYGLTFFHEMQVLASAGHAVFFANPRGSKGYGEEHAACIRGRWGGVDFEDIEAVTRFMARQPFVDPARMGIMGGSYGGFMANWAIGHTRAFKAAITDRSVSNLVSMAGSSDFPIVGSQYWEGTVWDRPQELWRQSPVRWLKAARTPTLVIHSEGDLRCNIEQGEQVFSALQVLGVRSRLVRYPPESSHGLSRSGPPDLRIHRLRQILEWWKEHLG